jgi:hypothetical protein
MARRVHVYPYQLHDEPVAGSTVSVRGLVDQTEVYSQTYTATDLATMFSSVKGDYETPQAAQLGPGESGVLYFFLNFTSPNNIPQTVENSFQVTNESGKSDTISIAPLQKQTAGAEVVNAPLRGSGWWTPNGPSNDSVHRRSLIVLDGELSITEEFAVDWVKLGQNGATFVGDPLNNASYFAYGQNIVAAAGGSIVEVVNDIIENTPTQPPNPNDLEVETLPGNHVVEDFGDGRYALYAHMIPGSIPVKKGDVVVPGQLVGRLGNSGNLSDQLRIQCGLQSYGRPHQSSGRDTRSGPATSFHEFGFGPLLKP